jgi:hypothetical protein
VRGKRSEPGEFANFYALRGKKSADSLSLLLEDILRVRRRAGSSTLHRHNTENSKQIFPGEELLGYTPTLQRKLYEFLFWELRGLSPNFQIFVSVSGLYIPWINPHISCSRIGRPGNI